MKVGIFTFHRANNYGAVLQAFALNKTLNNLGYDAYIIDYEPRKFRTMYYYEPADKGFSINEIARKFDKIKLKKTLYLRNSGFERFVHENIRLSPKLTKADILSESCPELTDFDAFITGSDQVWNDTCADFDRIFFLDFPTAKNAKKYSYAASFNLKQIPVNLIDEYEKRLHGFNAYSVREEIGKKFVRELTNNDALLSCDPTFLITKKEWKHISENSQIIEIIGKEPFILVYYVTLSRMLMEYAKKISQLKCMRVICIPCNTKYSVLSGKQYSEYDFQFLPTASPYDFLKLYNNASYVLSNSFHGTVFSMLFEKQFFSVLQGDKGVKNERSLDLLKKLNLGERIISASTNLSSIDNSIDWDNVSRVINRERKCAYLYLKEIGK